MGDGLKRAFAAAKKTRERERIRCPRCTKMIARAEDWAPGYPTLYKHKDFGGRVCDVGYLRQSKVHDGWTES